MKKRLFVIGAGIFFSVVGQAAESGLLDAATKFEGRYHKIGCVREDSFTRQEFDFRVFQDSRDHGAVTIDASFEQSFENRFLVRKFGTDSESWTTRNQWGCEHHFESVSFSENRIVRTSGSRFFTFCIAPKAVQENRVEMRLDGERLTVKNRFDGADTETECVFAKVSN